MFLLDGFKKSNPKKQQQLFRGTPGVYLISVIKITDIKFKMFHKVGKLDPTYKPVQRIQPHFELGPVKPNWK